MATIDIGKIKPVFRGTYDNSTAYVLDDIVYYNGSSYVAKTSTTGNLPTDTTKWNILASGSGGIWDSTLSIGSAGQVVKVSSGGALEFGAVESNVVKLASGTISSGVSALELDHFSSTYNLYKMEVINFRPSSSANLRVRVRSGGSNDNSSYYDYITNHGMVNSGSSTSFNNHGEWDSSHWGINGSNDTSSHSLRGCSSTITFYDPNSGLVKQAIWNTANETNSGQIEVFNGMGNVASTTQYTGFSIYFDGTTIVSGKYILYGFKS